MEHVRRLDAKGAPFRRSTHRILRYRSVAYAAMQMKSYPRFHNEVGVPIVRIGCREFKCIGDKPPQDHPHIYLNIGDAGEIVCPYCSTRFRFDPSLGAHEVDPANCAYGDID